MKVLNWQRAVSFEGELKGFNQDKIVTLYENIPDRVRSLYQIDSKYPITVNGFLKNFRIYYSIGSLPAPPRPDFDPLEPNESKQLKAAFMQWDSQRRQVALYVGSHPNSWKMIGGLSLLNTEPYPFQQYDALLVYTANEALEVSGNGRIGIQLENAGWGYLNDNLDKVSIFGSVVEEIFVFDPTEDQAPVIIGGNGGTGTLTDWQTVHGIGDLQARPAPSSANSGYLYASTSDKTLYRSNGGAWIAIASLDSLSNVESFGFLWKRESGGVGTVSLSTELIQRIESATPDQPVQMGTAALLEDSQVTKPADLGNAFQGHIQDPDPHPQYLTQQEAEILFGQGEGGLTTPASIGALAVEQNLGDLQNIDVAKTNLDITDQAIAARILSGGDSLPVPSDENLYHYFYVEREGLYQNVGYTWTLVTGHYIRKEFTQTTPLTTWQFNHNIYDKRPATVRVVSDDTGDTNQVNISDQDGYMILRFETPQTGMVILTW